MVATGPSPSVDLGMLVLPAPTVPHALPGLEWGRGNIKDTTPGGYGRDTRYSTNGRVGEDGREVPRLESWTRMQQQHKPASR